MDFTVPAHLLKDIDLELVERGVLTFSGKHSPQTRCPSCDKLVDIETSTDKFGEVRYSIFCPHCEVWEDRVIDPQEVEILDFNYRQLLFFIQDKESFGDYVNEVAKCLPADENAFKVKKVKNEGPPKTKCKFKYKAGRFEYTDNIHDVRLFDPDMHFAKFLPYYNLDKPTAAHEAIKAVLTEYKKKNSEGWVRVDDSWHTGFPAYRYPSVKRFKEQQIEVGNRTIGHNGEWRILPDAELDERYRRWNHYT